MRESCTAGPRGSSATPHLGHAGVPDEVVQRTDGFGGHDSCQTVSLKDRFTTRASPRPVELFDVGNRSSSEWQMSPRLREGASCDGASLRQTSFRHEVLESGSLLLSASAPQMKPPVF
jgi:hypothetical protein